MTDWSPAPAWMFCPADRPDRYLKALKAADIVVLDLEDAVAPTAKLGARGAIEELASTGQLDIDRTVVRINSAPTADHRSDLALVRAVGLRRVMLAKAEETRDVAAVDAELVVLIESPIGLANAERLAETENVVAMMWGADDLVAGLGGFTSRHLDGRHRDIARYARQRVLVAAKAHGHAAIDGVHMDIPDLVGLREECLDAVATGFDATVAIHPSQLATIRAAYAPNPDQVDWAERLLAHVGVDRGVTTFDGRMVDGPVFKQAERILNRHRLSQTGSLST